LDLLLLLDLLLFLLDFVDEDAELHQVVGLRDGRRVGFFVGLEGNKPMLVGCNESVGDIVGFKVGRILGLKVLKETERRVDNCECQRNIASGAIRRAITAILKLTVRAWG